MDSEEATGGVLCKKGVLDNFAEFTGKHLCQSLFLKSLLKKRLWHRCFLVNFEKFSRALQNTSGRLLQWITSYRAYANFRAVRDLNSEIDV